jgi:hypothetical protein
LDLRSIWEGCIRPVERSWDCRQLWIGIRRTTGKPGTSFQLFLSGRGEMEFGEQNGDIKLWIFGEGDALKGKLPVENMRERDAKLQSGILLEENHGRVIR